MASDEKPRRPVAEALLSGEDGVLDIGFAQLDVDRERRTGCPEVVYCAGKTDDQVAHIFDVVEARGDRLIGTKASASQAQRVSSVCPDAWFHEVSGVLSNRPPGAAREHGPLIAVVTGGTSDIPIAEESAVTLELMGYRVNRLFDVGVAGLHRLLRRLEEVTEADVVIAVAGMEGTLPSVVGGLVRAPVVAVPTSVGYGANLQGISAMLAMMTSCVPGVSVVNIDNGFGAAMVAHKLALNAEQLAQRLTPREMVGEA